MCVCVCVEQERQPQGSLPLWGTHSCAQSQVHSSHPYKIFGRAPYGTALLLSLWQVSMPALCVGWKKDSLAPLGQPQLPTRPWREHTEPARSLLCLGCQHPGAGPQHEQAQCYPRMPGHSWNPTQLDPDLPRAHGPFSTWVNGFYQNRCPWHSPVPNWPHWPVLATSLAMGGQNPAMGCHPCAWGPRSTRSLCALLQEACGRAGSESWVGICAPEVLCCRSCFLARRHQCHGVSPSAELSHPAGIFISKTPSYFSEGCWKHDLRAAAE